MYFFSTEILTFWTFRENLLIKLHSTANFLQLAVFKNLKVFLRIIIFFSKSQFLNVLRNITNSVAIYCKLANFINFLKNRIFISEKPIHFFKKNTIFWNALRILTFSVALWCNFATFSDFRKSKNFFEIAISDFSKKQNFWTFWEILLIQLHSASNWLLLLAVSEKTQDFFLKNQSFFQEENNFSTFW